MNWLVIADDLSGAADCAIGFALHGAHAVVVLDEVPAEALQADVVAADADSRRLAPPAAAARSVATWHQGEGPTRRLYKKIDSTLRGNWAAETAALVPLAGLALVAPAFPATGRTTVAGRMLVNGRPLEGSDIWRLERLAGPADLCALLAAQGLRSALLPLDAIRSGSAALRARIEALAREGVQALACDAETEQDLAALAAASIDLTAPAFWVGSGGLARALAAQAPLTSNTPLPPEPVGRPVLTMVGSLSGVSGRQTACLRERSGMAALTVPPQVLRDGPAHARWAELQQAIAAPLQAGADLLLGIGRDDAFDPAEGPRLSTALAQLALPGFQHAGGLIATGGETARAMLAAAGIAALTLRREVEPGVPLSSSPARPGLPARRIVTKAGAFGSDAALWLAWQAMTETITPQETRP